VPRLTIIPTLPLVLVATGYGTGQTRSVLGDVVRARQLLAKASPEDSLLALSLPSAPATALQPKDVVQALCRGLQYNDLPSPDAGLTRLFGFATYECRAAVTARKGKDSTERFIRWATAAAPLASPRSALLRATE
jgi:hypothetical protein